MTRKSSDERREEIVDAFLATLAEHGYGKATIHRVAERAQLTPGLLHYHFRNKQAILLTLLQRLVRLQLGQLQRIVDSEVVASQKVEEMIDAFLAMGSDRDPAIVAAWVSISAEAVRQPKVGEEFREAIRIFRDLFEQVLKEGQKSGVFEFKGVDSVASAAAILATIQGYFALAATARELIPRGSAAEATRQMVRGLFYVESSQDSAVDQ